MNLKYVLHNVVLLICMLMVCIHVSGSFAETTDLLLLPSDLQMLGEEAFAGDESLCEIVVQPGVTLIPRGAFRECTHLSRITLPDTLQEIGEFAFFHDYNLSDIVVPSNISRIGAHAFEGCGSLSHIEIPASVSYIGEDAFSGADNLSFTVYEGTYGEIWCAENSMAYELEYTAEAIRNASKENIEELQLARNLGLYEVVTGDGNDLISCDSFVALLDSFMQSAAPDRYNDWQSALPQMRGSYATMTRGDAAIAVIIAAEYAGGDYALLGEDCFGWYDLVDWDKCLFHEEYFTGEESPYTQSPLDSSEDNLRYLSACHYLCSRVSFLHCEPLLDIVNGSLNLQKPLTVDAAMSMLTRFWYSDYAAESAGVEALNIDVVPPFDDYRTEKDVKIADILSTDSQYSITTGGHVYYVSPDGSDYNDGLSPETAWCSLDKVNSGIPASADWKYNNPDFPEFIWAGLHPDLRVELLPGDAVLFERGGVWRGVLRCAAGVTYSAYGEGPKPAIYASNENSSNSQYWAQVEGTSNLWVYYRDVTDIGAIVLDDSAIAKKHNVYWDGSRYVDYPNGYIPFDMTVSLEEYGQYRTMDPYALADLEFYCEIVRSSDQRNPMDKGKLYLRCDAGNPGEVYRSIEFVGEEKSLFEGWAVSVNTNCTIDNMEIRYGGTGIYCEEYCNVRNCVVKWCGGVDVGSYVSVEGDQAYFRTDRCGNGIDCGGNHNTVENCYVSECYDTGICCEGFSGAAEPGDEIYELRVFLHDNTIRNNVIEFCKDGVAIIDFPASECGQGKEHFKNITVEGNYILDSGLGKHNHTMVYGNYMNPVYHGRDDAEGLWIHAYPGSENILIKDNVILNSHEGGQLINVVTFDDAYDVITFENNTLGQSYPGVIIQESHRGFVNPDGGWINRYVYNDSRVDESIATIPLNMTQTILSRWSKSYNHSIE